MIKDFLALAALVMFASVSAEEIATDFPLDGPTAFSAAPGETKIYTGKISGTGPVIIDAGDPSIGRGGTVVFTNPENDYTGGTLISNAVFRVDADGAAGGDPISIVLGRQKVDGNWVNRGQLNVNCSSLANTINYLDRSPSDMECILLLSVPTTLSAIKMHLAKASGGFEACIRSCSSEGPSVIAGPVEVEHVSGSETVLIPYPAGGEH